MKNIKQKFPISVCTIISSWAFSCALGGPFTASKTQIFPDQPDPLQKSRVGQRKTGRGFLLPKFLQTLNPRNINSAA